MQEASRAVCWWNRQSCLGRMLPHSPCSHRDVLQGSGQTLRCHKHQVQRLVIRGLHCNMLPPCFFLSFYSLANNHDDHHDGFTIHPCTEGLAGVLQSRQTLWCWAEPGLNPFGHSPDKSDTVALWDNTQLLQLCVCPSFLQTTVSFKLCPSSTFNKWNRSCGVKRKCCTDWGMKYVSKASQMKAVQELLILPFPNLLI